MTQPENEQKAEALILKITVRGREGLAFEGKAKSLSSLNGKGNFDILPFHTNFVSIVNSTIRIIKEDDQPQLIELKRGILRVKENFIEVYLGI